MESFLVGLIVTILLNTVVIFGLSTLTYVQIVSIIWALKLILIQLFATSVNGLHVEKITYDENRNIINKEKIN